MNVCGAWTQCVRLNVRLRFRICPEEVSKGTLIVQADSGVDSDSESPNKNEEIIPVNRLTPTV